MSYFFFGGGKLTSEDTIKAYKDVPDTTRSYKDVPDTTRTYKDVPDSTYFYRMEYEADIIAQSHRTDESCRLYPFDNSSIFSSHMTVLPVLMIGLSMAQKLNMKDEFFPPLSQMTYRSFM